MESQAKFASLIAFLMLFGTLTSLIVPVSADETVDNYPDGDAWLRLELLSWEGNQSEEWDSGNGAPDPHFKVCVDADGEDIDCFNSPTWDNSWTLGPVWNLTFDIPDDSYIINFTIECRDNDALNDDECDMNPDPDEWKLYFEFNWTTMNMTNFSGDGQLDSDTSWKGSSSNWTTSIFQPNENTSSNNTEEDDEGEGGEENNTTNTPPSCFIHWYRDGDDLTNPGMALLTAGDTFDEITVTEGDSFTIYIYCWDDDGDEMTLSITPPFGSNASFTGTSVSKFIQLTVPTGYAGKFEFGAEWSDGATGGEFEFDIIIESAEDEGDDESEESDSTSSASFVPGFTGVFTIAAFLGAVLVMMRREQEQ